MARSSLTQNNVAVEADAGGRNLEVVVIGKADSDDVVDVAAELATLADKLDTLADKLDDIITNTTPA